MEFAKLMAVSDKAVPTHLRANAGACLRIVFQAIEWQMSPWAVADSSFEVNDRIAYDSQLIHAIIEARAPLRQRLDCSYDGEGPERTCTVIGEFTDGSRREYTTPTVAKIRVKNSPLWRDDPDQQLFYAASRSWARKWCPDVLKGLYTKEELETAAPIVGEESGLHARLAAVNVDREEGHQEGYAGDTLTELEKGEDTEEPPKAALGVGAGRDVRNFRTSRAARAGKKKAPPAKKAVAKKSAAAKTESTPAAVEETKTEPIGPVEAPLPSNPKQYTVFVKGWLAGMTNPAAIRIRWKNERTLRNRAGITADDRAPIEALVEARCNELAEK
jgi:hypothetical protein